MGLYINPQNMTKERWLAENGVRTEEPRSVNEATLGYWYVMLVDNGMFTAAGVAFNDGELDAMRPRLGDHRAREWFLVKGDRLAEVGSDPLPWVEKYGR